MARPTQPSAHFAFPCPGFPAPQTLGLDTCAAWVAEYDAETVLSPRERAHCELLNLYVEGAAGLDLDEAGRAA